MIASTKKDKAIPKKADKYPCLMQDTISETVILLTGNGMGMVVHGKGIDKYTTAGNYLGGWVMDYLKPYDGKIVLENKTL